MLGRVLEVSGARFRDIVRCLVLFLEALGRRFKGIFRMTGLL